MDHSIDIAYVRRLLLDLQQQIVSALEQLDGKHFMRDEWQRCTEDPLSGDGMTCVLEQGHLFERAGVSFSQVRGILPQAATVARSHLTGCRFEALGVSLVLHPENPYCPTVHMNVRLLVCSAEHRSTLEHTRTVALEPIEIEPIFWFGGGMDLTPYYGFHDDARHFHRICRNALMPFGADLYPRFKRWCDEYFFLKYRGEPRGIGGIFYDDFSELGFTRGVEMMQSVGNAFLTAYRPIIEARRHLPFGDRERAFQAYRRSRYAEFNLLLDRGTLFGLQSGGRIESILMSLPPIAHWRYNWKPPTGSAEAQLGQEFLVVRDWL